MMCINVGLFSCESPAKMSHLIVIYLNVLFYISWVGLCPYIIFLLLFFCILFLIHYISCLGFYN